MTAAAVAPSPADYAPEIEGVEFGEVYAEVHGDLGEADLLDALRIAAGLHRCSTWWLGDLLAYGEDKVWDTYADAAEATGFATGSLRNMASISRQVPPEMREPGLPWRTHKVVAPLKADEQREWLALALAKGMASDEVARAIRGSGSSGPGPDDPTGGACVCPKCGGAGVITKEKAS